MKRETLDASKAYAKKGPDDERFYVSLPVNSHGYQDLHEIENQEETFLSMLQDDTSSNKQDNEQKPDNKSVNNKPEQLNNRLFKHLLQEKKGQESPPRIPSCMKISHNILNTAPEIPEVDYDESDDKLSVIDTAHGNLSQRDLWSNACRQNTNNGGILKYEQNKLPTNTLKEALRNRAPVAEFIREITKANEEDIVNRKQRERERLCVHGVFTEDDIVENENEQIYREILEVVQANSPSSLPVSRGRMVGEEDHNENTNLNSMNNQRTKKHQRRPSHTKNKTR